MLLFDGDEAKVLTISSDFVKKNQRHSLGYINRKGHLLPYITRIY